jgi:regulation of enolase protein 1 (concanavalin A-like superfamily)
MPQQTESPTALLVISTPSGPSPSPALPGSVSFEALDNQNTLNPEFTWYPGTSSANAYSLSRSPGALTIIAGPKTDQWMNDNSAPLMLYPIEGDFVVQVKVAFFPKRHVQGAGIGLRTRQTPNTFVRIKREFHNGEQKIAVNANQNGEPIDLGSTPYSGDVVYFKIERIGSLCSLSYSPDKNKWILLKENFAFTSQEIELYFIALSTDENDEVVAVFSELQIISQ